MNLIAGFIGKYSLIPKHKALIQDDRVLNYSDFFQKTRQIACFLQSHAIHQQRIGIALDRGIDACVAIFGTLYSGNCYLPLDIRNPDHRLNFIVEDADVTYVIGAGPCPAWLQEAAKWIDIEQLFKLEATDKRCADVHPESLAAILYTSGSTGTPKGVALSHRAILNFTVWAEKTFTLSQDDQVASLAPFHFDLSTFDLFCSLNAGATVNFIPAKLTLSPSRLSTWLANTNISIWYTVPSILSFLSLKGALQTTPLPHLKTLLFAGEVFSSERLIKLANLLPDVDLFNLYGPTETNVCCYWPVDRTRLNNYTPIPIGKPACQAKLSIDKQSCELIVEGRNNFSGYWQRGQLVAQNLAQQHYKTGDKVSLNAFGEYCFHGRLDRMIKSSGYRIEPAEIETVIKQIKGVEDCAVLGINDLICGQKPVAVVILKTDYNLSDVIDTVRQQLPNYMLPSKYIHLMQLPYLSNGKIDYPGLQQTIAVQ